MVIIKVYGTTFCPYCIRAKMLLKKEGLEFEDILLKSEEEKAELIKKTKQMTVPQIFIGDEFIGGFDQLYELKKSGELDKKVGRKEKIAA